LALYKLLNLARHELRVSNYGGLKLSRTKKRKKNKNERQATPLKKYFFWTMGVVLKRLQTQKDEKEQNKQNKGRKKTIAK